jgi:hypothetical protein
MKQSEYLSQSKYEDILVAMEQAIKSDKEANQVKLEIKEGGNPLTEIHEESMTEFKSIEDAWSKVDLQDKQTLLGDENKFMLLDISVGS